MPFNVGGYPAVSGFGAGRLPVAIQLVGKPFQEPTVLRIANAFEKAMPFRRGSRPAIATGMALGECKSLLQADLSI